MKMFLGSFFRQNVGKLLVLSVLILLTVLYTVPWTVRSSIENEYSGLDFHGYWYAGHFIRQGINSYAAVVNDPNPNYWDPRIPGSGNPYLLGGAESSLELPVYYLDGFVADAHPIAQAMIVVPAVTAPLNILIGLFSWFSWQTARLIWMILNLIFAALIPWLALRLTREPNQLRLVDKFIFAFVFYNIYGLRQSIVVGQQTLICLLLLILALLFKKNWVISGILLGFGISKYSVGLPVFLYFLLQRKNSTIMVSILVQAIAILLLIPFKSGSPLNTLMAYFKIIAVNYSQDGVHLAARFTDGTLPTILSVIVLIVLILMMVRQDRITLKPEESIVDLNDLNLMTLAVFLIAYHQIHDMSFMIFFLLLFLAKAVESEGYWFNRASYPIYILITMLVVPLLLFPALPGQLYVRFEIFKDMPLHWISMESVSTIVLILMFALSVWFQLQVPFHSKISAWNEKQ